MPTVVYRFGVFELDGRTRELTRAGRRVHLAPQAASLLSMLTARAGDVVTRDEIRAALWPTGTFVDFESAVNACVSQIRAGLGDRASSPRFIETLPKRGYRFIAPVETADAPRREHRRWRAETTGSADSRAFAPHVPMVGTKGIRRAVLAVLSASAVALAIIAFVTASRNSLRATPAPRLGVLPIASSGGDHTLGSIGIVLQEQTLIALVERGVSAAIIAKPAVEHLRGDARTVEALRALNLDFFVDASLEPLPDGLVRLHTKVVRGADLRILSAADYELPADALLARRRDLAAELSDRLLLAAARSPMSESAVNVGARDLALSGSAAMERGDVEKAIARLEEATAGEPANPWIRGLLARAMARSALSGQRPFHTALERARLEAAEALRHDPANPDALAALGAVQLWGDRDRSRAGISLARAAKSPRTSSDATIWYAAWLHAEGRESEADEFVAGLSHRQPLTFSRAQMPQRVSQLAAQSASQHVTSR